MLGHEDHDHSHIMSDVAPMALFVITANLARKLKISPTEFGEMLGDIDGAHEYLEELMLATMKAKIDERRKKK
jgi:hypothetical protein